MCGLFGFHTTSRLSHNEREALVTLGFISSRRGTDSTGVSCLYREKGKDYYIIAKDVMSSPEFLSSKKAECVYNTDNFSMIGHCRAATIGEVTIDNAHPFHVGDIVGMHNGTIPSLREGAKTDSYELFSRISKSSLEEAIQSINGQKAFALTYYNLKDVTLNITRNMDRTLFYVYTKGAVMYYASEKEMLNFALLRHNIEPTSEILPFEVGKQYIYNKSSIMPVDVKEYKSHKVYVPVISHVVNRGTVSSGPTFPGAYEDNRNNSHKERLGFPFDPKGDRRSLNPSNSKHIEETKEETEGKKGQAEKVYVGKRNTVITEEENRELIASGCSFCKAPIDDEETYYMFYEYPDPVCGSCMDDYRDMSNLFCECGPKHKH